MTEQQTRSALPDPPRHRSETQARRQARLVTVVLLVVAAAVAIWLLLDVFSGEVGSAGSPSPSTAGQSTVATTTTVPPQPIAVPPDSLGAPWGTTEGVTMFRGNPTRSWFGQGTLGAEPQIEWSYPEGEMCSVSVDLGEESEWCGTGWTGQPLVWTNLEGTTEVVFGGYDGAVHFLDAATGQPTREPFATDDLIKGFGAIDPDGYPLLYFGSRDNKFRIVALDREPVGRAVVDGRLRCRWSVERRLGLEPGDHRRDPLCGRRERLVLRHRVEPQLWGAGQGAGPPRDPVLGTHIRRRVPRHAQRGQAHAAHRRTAPRRQRVRSRLRRRDQRGEQPGVLPQQGLHRQLGGSDPRLRHQSTSGKGGLPSCSTTGRAATSTAHHGGGPEGPVDRAHRIRAERQGGKAPHVSGRSRPPA